MEAVCEISEEDKRPDLNTSSATNNTYEFDDLLRLVGGFGLYPRLLYGFMCLMTIPIGLQQLVLVFYGASPPYHCTSTSVNANSTCSADKCCANCTKYEFDGEFTSAVSEVMLQFYFVFKGFCFTINFTFVLWCLTCFIGGIFK